MFHFKRLILGGHKLKNKQPFFLPLDPIDKNNKDSDTIDLKAQCYAKDMHKAWNKSQTTVYWVDINLAMKKN